MSGGPEAPKPQFDPQPCDEANCAALGLLQVSLDRSYGPDDHADAVLDSIVFACNQTDGCTLEPGKHLRADGSVSEAEETSQ